MTGGSARRATAAQAALAASLAASLAACIQTPPASPPAAAAPARQAVERPFPPHPARKPPPPGPQQARQKSLRQAQLQGLDQATAVALLGEPTERTEAAPAMLWRYAKSGCELDLYFYLDLQSREMRVLHYDVRVTEGSGRTEQRCYDELVNAHRASEAEGTDRPR